MRYPRRPVASALPDVLLAVAVILLAGLPAYRSAAAATIDVDAVLSAVDEVKRAHQVPAVGLALVSADSVLWAGAWGTADVASARPATGDTVFRIGSVTKAFTALALLILAEDGQLQIDAPIADLVREPSIVNRWKQSRPLRLVHLLEHTGGLLDLSKVEFDHNEPLPLAQAVNVHPETWETHWPPGLHCEYSNAGYGLAGYILEQVSGLSFEAFVSSRIFAPLDMRRSGFFLNREHEGRLATGYQADGHEPIPYWHMIYRPFGGMNSTPVDMAAFLQLLLNYGRSPAVRLLPAAAIERMESPQTTLAARAGLHYGYGFGNYQWYRNAYLFHGHGGDADGYLSHYGYNRDAGLAYFVVINAFNRQALREIRVRIETAITAVLPQRRAPAAAVSNAGLRSYAGHYIAVTRRFPWSAAGASLEVVFDSDGLYTRKPGDGLRRLVAVTPRLFRRPDDYAATAAFVEYQGDLYLQGDMGNYRRLGPVAGKPH